ncbi:MAG: hypothetical protein AAGC81_03795 [Pseudomonadota bacterium]
MRLSIVSVMLVTVIAVASCATTPRRSVAEFSAPPVALEGRGVQLAVAVQPEFDFYEEGTAMQDGIAAYFARYVPEWRVSDLATAQNPDLTLKCTTLNDGWSNYADTIVDCDLARDGEEELAFRRVFASETGGKGGDTESFKAQAFNQGLGIGEEVSERISKDPDLNVIAGRDDRREALDDALASQDPQQLLDVAQKYPGTVEAERAVDIAQEWLKQAEVEEEEIAETDETAQTPATELAAANETTQEVEPQPASAPKPSPAPEAEATTTQTAAVSEPATPAPDPTALSCYDERRGFCGDYQFPTRAKRDEFARSCRNLGSRVLEAGQSCSRGSGAIGCKQTSGGTSVITWVYNLGSNQVAQSCSLNGGTVVRN